MKQPRWHYVLFCFHPKFDNGTWTVAAALSTVVIFGALFFITLAFSAPKCLCPEIWEHIDALSSEIKAIYVIGLFILLGVVIISILCIYGTFKAQSGKLVLYFLTMIFIEAATVFGSIYIFRQLTHIDQFLLFDNGSYWNLAKKVLKENLITNLEGTWASVNILLKNFLSMDMGEDLNLNTLLDAALKDEVLILMGAGKRVIKISAVLMLLGLNWLFISSAIVSFSHWRRLKSGVENHFSLVPNIMRSQKLASDSYRSTETDTLSDHYYSKRRSSKPFKNTGSRSNSVRISRKHEHFQREEYL